MSQPVTRITQSPMNPTRWVADLACGHETWITRKARPTATRLSCPQCDGGKKAQKSESPA